MPQHGLRTMNTPASVRYHPAAVRPGVEVTAGAGRFRRCLAHPAKGQSRAFLGFGSMTNVLAPVAEKLDGTLHRHARFVKPTGRGVSCLRPRVRTI